MELTSGGPAPARVVVVGTGSIGMRHLRVLASLPGVSAVAAPTRAERALELRAHGFEVADSVRDTLENGISGVLIATDTGRHVTDALAAAGVPRLVEKPLAPSASAAECLRGGASVHVACVLRFDEGLLWVRDRLPGLGRLGMVDAECLSWLPAWRPDRDYRAGYGARPNEGGALLDLIHEIDYCAWLFGPVSMVNATLENKGTLGLPPEVEEAAHLLLEHTSGLLTSLRLSYAVRPPSRKLRIWGESGYLSWDGIYRTASHVDVEGRTLETHSWAGPDGMFRAQDSAWVGSLRGENPAQLATLEEGIAALRVCDAARASSRSRAWVKT